MTDEAAEQPAVAEPSAWLENIQMVAAHPDFQGLAQFSDAQILRLIFMAAHDCTVAIRNLRAPFSPQTIAAVEKMAAQYAKEIDETEGWKDDKPA